jgi:hypothetical protein
VIKAHITINKIKAEREREIEKEKKEDGYAWFYYLERHSLSFDMLFTHMCCYTSSDDVRSLEKKKNMGI